MANEIRNVSALFLATVLWVGSAVAQQTQTQPQAPGTDSSSPQQVISDQDVEMLRHDIRSQKKQLIAQNLSLTDAEAQKFWPVYDRFTADLVKINDKKYSLIQQYAQNYDQLTDAQVNSWVEGWLQLDQDVSALRQRYLPEFQKVLSPKKVARYEQLDRRTQLMIDLQLASQIPLVPVSH